MKRLWVGVGFLILSVTLAQNCRAGMVVQIQDPRYFQRQQEVIFPWAEVKLVTFEFELVGEGAEASAKQKARELHDRFLARIQNLQGGAIVTYVTPPGQRIENYRVEAEKVGQAQKAQMVLWGRIMLDSEQVPLINPRLMLVSAPPGVSAAYSRAIDRDVETVSVEGLIDAPVTELRVDFNTMKQDVAPLVSFLAGLARYYKGAAREGSAARPWLEGSVRDFSDYVRQTPEQQDSSALAQANLFIARACIRLAAAETARKQSHLARARSHAAEAARLNPYNPSVAVVQAVVAARENADPALIRTFLAKAVQLAPADADARINLAVFDGARGDVKNAVRQLDEAAFVQKSQGKAISPSVPILRGEFERMRTPR
ncbi:MAG TPA: hypothetical protein VI078_14995 [bacterium]